MLRILRLNAGFRGSAQMRSPLGFSLTGGFDFQRLFAVIMAWFARDKEKERFYLLPGMGGRNLRRKRAVILRWSIVAGLLTSALLGGILYLMSRRY